MAVISFSRRLRELAEAQVRIGAFGESGDGEVYALGYIDGTLHELAAMPVVTYR